MYQLHFVVEPYKKNRRINSVRISETQQKMCYGVFSLIFTSKLGFSSKKIEGRQRVLVDVERARTVNGSLPQSLGKYSMTRGQKIRKIGVICTALLECKLTEEFLSLSLVSRFYMPVLLIPLFLP